MFYQTSCTSTCFEHYVVIIVTPLKHEKLKLQLPVHFYIVRVRSQSSSQYNTGRFIMFNVITNIYNKKTIGLTLMELFTATGKLKKFLFFDN